ncbi:MAG TPA: MerR family transcriptional regulator [Myxococcota bacterium]|nr:MerR family transcriptional regulator [Myxococcota bacterium]
MKSRAKPNGRSSLAIGELARRFDLATSVLRHWESQGVLRAPARASGARRYEESDTYRVGLILLCQEAGFSLRETRAATGTRSLSARRRLLLRKRAELEQRIARAEAARRMIDEALACRARDPLDCAHFRRAIEGRSGRLGQPRRRASRRASEAAKSPAMPGSGTT